MTAAEIIAANPEYGFEPATIGGMTGLKGRHPETGAEHWCVYCDASHVAAPGPWSHADIKAAAASLAGSMAHVDRGRYIDKPTRTGTEGA